jgi:hypothetical protein
VDGGHPSSSRFDPPHIRGSKAGRTILELVLPCHRESEHPDNGGVSQRVLHRHPNKVIRLTMVAAGASVNSMMTASDATRTGLPDCKHCRSTIGHYFSHVPHMTWPNFGMSK